MMFGCSHDWRLEYYCRNQEETHEPMLRCSRCGATRKEPYTGDRKAFWDAVGKAKEDAE